MIVLPLCGVSTIGPASSLLPTRCPGLQDREEAWHLSATRGIFLFNFRCTPSPSRLRIPRGDPERPAPASLFFDRCTDDGSTDRQLIIIQPRVHGMARVRCPADCTAGLPAGAFFKAKARLSKCVCRDRRRVQLRFIVASMPMACFGAVRVVPPRSSSLRSGIRRYLTCTSSPLFLFSTCGALLLCSALLERSGHGAPLRLD